MGWKHERISERAIEEILVRLNKRTLAGSALATLGYDTGEMAGLNEGALPVPSRIRSDNPDVPQRLVVPSPPCLRAFYPRAAYLTLAIRVKADDETFP